MIDHEAAELQDHSLDLRAPLTGSRHAQVSKILLKYRGFARLGMGLQRVRAACQWRPWLNRDSHCRRHEQTPQHALAGRALTANGQLYQVLGRTSKNCFEALGRDHSNGRITIFDCGLITSTQETFTRSVICALSRSIDARADGLRKASRANFQAVASSLRYMYIASLSQ